MTARKLYYHRQRYAAFTLVELLVVTAIIAMLIAILLPALSQAREQAKSLYCLNNLRQCAFAATAYAQDYHGSFPIAYYNAFIPGGGMTSYAWDFTHSVDWSTNPPTRTTEPGIIWTYSTNGQVQQCPSFDGAANWMDDPYTGYNYNTSYIGNPPTSYMDAGRRILVPGPSKVHNVANPSDTAMFGDGEYEGGANKYMRAPWRNPRDGSFSGRFSGTQGYRHLDKTSVAFCDGHAASWAERYVESYASDTANLLQYNKHADVKVGFLSPDNSMYDLE